MNSFPMARGLTLQPRLLLPLPAPKSQLLLLSPQLHQLRCPINLPPCISTPRFARYRCCCSLTKEELAVEAMANYKEAFSRRMEMAGLKPHHRIAIGVSGGPDSMALCVLTAGWKLDGNNGAAVGKSGGFIDGLLAIVVDHGLRPESNEEAHVVSHRVSEMGIRCEIACCIWVDGRPKQGHVQGAAREMRYQMFQKVCLQHQISMLLIAHHADDQAELFLLRLSRNSGVLGLSGMAFTSQMFSSGTNLCSAGLPSEGILVVRPLLHFSKEDMYKICQDGGQNWVEDPTNQSSLYARNRIRMSLGNLSSSIFRSELQAVISACRKTRAYIDHVNHNLLNQAVTVMDEGYAVVDLEILNPSQVTDICLSKFVTSLLQFISQRHRPVRGHTSKLLLEYFRTFPCKTSLTAAGCYLSPAPGSRGTKVVVCYSINCPLPSKTELFQIHPDGEQKRPVPSDLEQIIADGKSYYNHVVPDVSDVHFLDVPSGSVLTEARRLNMISESTYNDILQLQRDETKSFKSKTGDKVDYEPKSEVPSSNKYPSEPLQPGQMCYFMNRFLVTWKLSWHDDINAVPGRADIHEELGRGITNDHCQSCRIGNDVVVKVRPMTESDWLYLAKLSNCLESNDLPQQGVYVSSNEEQVPGQRHPELNDLKLIAKRALSLLKSIPVAARRSLPVLVSCEGQLLSIPTIGFNYCSCLRVSCKFKPRTPLGGGHNSFL